MYDYYDSNDMDGNAATAENADASRAVSYNDHVSMTKNKAPKTKSAIPRFLMSIIALTIAIVLGLTILKKEQPDLFYQLILTLDIFGVSFDTEEDKQRASKIELLPISSEKKELIRNRSIFMEAAPHMVKLALGKPRLSQNSISPTSGKEVLMWMYHFKADKRPTILEFEDNKLSSAYKISNIVQ